MEQLREPSPLEDGDDHPERGDHRQQEPDGGLDGHQDRSEHGHQQDDREAHNDQPERNQSVGEPGGDVDSHRRRACHGEGGVVAILDRGSEVANRLHELLGGERVRRAGGCDLQDRGVEPLIRNPLGDEVDIGKSSQVACDGLQIAQDVRGLGDVDGHDERAVIASPEPRAHEIVGLSLGGTEGLRPSVGQVQVEAERRDGEGAEDHHHTDSGEDGPLHDALHPPHAHALLLLGIGVGPLPRARTDLRRETTLRETEECRKQRGGYPDGDEHGNGSAHPHDAEKRNPDHEQSQQGDDHGQPREDDSAAGGADRHRGRLLRILSPRQLGSMPRQDEQGVVDTDREPDHQGEERRGA